MDRKELVKIAKDIAEQEQIIQSSKNKEEASKAEAKITEYTQRITSIYDLLELDTLIQEFLT